MRTIYGLSVTEIGADRSGISIEIFNAITHCYPTKERAVDTARKLLDGDNGILYVEVYVDTFYKYEIKREYIAKLFA